MKIYAGELVGRVLKQEGVTRVFGLCGGHNMPIIKGIAKNGIEFIGTHHEESAIHMAETWARATHQIGVAVVTAGPGVANAMPGIIVAQKAKSPVLVISGRSSDLMEDMEDAQELDHMALVKPVTKWAQTVHCAARIPEMTATAVRMALSGRPGVTFLDIPKNISSEEEYKVEESEIPEVENYRTSAKPYGDPELVKKAVDTLFAASCPLLVVGSGAVFSDAGKELNKFCEKSGIPVVTWKYAKGIVSDDKPNVTSVYALTMADTVMVLGTQLDWSLGFGRAPMIRADAKVIQIDIDAGEIGHNRGVDIGIVGDVKMVLKQMLDYLGSVGKLNMMQGWPPAYHSPIAQGHIDKVGKSAKESIDLIDLCVTLDSKVERNAIVVADGGETSIYSIWYMKAHDQFGLNIPPTLGHLGCGLPSAIAFKMAFPDRQVVLLTGDGALGFTVMELNTALRFDVPIKVVVANDSAWGNIQQFCTRTYGCSKLEGTCLGETRYDKMFEGLGGSGEMVTELSQLSGTVDRMLASDKPYLINVRIDNSISLARTIGTTPFPMM